MEELITTKLEDLIADQIEYSKKFNPDTQEHTAVVGNIATLYRAYNDGVKTKSEIDIKRQEMSDADYDREKEREMKASQYDFDRKARWIGYAVTGAELVIPLVFNGILVAKGFKFEETGTVRSFFTKNVLQNQLRFKK